MRHPAARGTVADVVRGQPSSPWARRCGSAMARCWYRVELSTPFGI